MSTGTKTRNPVEYFHGYVLDAFHEYRKERGLGLAFMVSGTEFSDIVAIAKRRYYKEFPVESSNEQSVTKEMKSVRVDLFSPCEKAILNAQYELEKVGASEGLTEAAILLSKARQLVCDYLLNK